jgi:uncharacterized protein YbaR (Trm112 family)
MHIELVDILRCPNPHDDTWLVATVEHMADRHIVDGTLGCPKCLAEYPVRDGVVFFAAEEIAPVTLPPGSHDLALLLAAALALTDPRVVALLQGEWTTQAHLLRSLSPSRLLLLNPPRDLGADDDVSKIVSTGVPVAAASIGAAAFDVSASPANRDAITRALRPGGRLVGPIASPLPDGVKELTRTETLWVAEREASVPVMVPLGRARTRGS